MSGPLQVDVYVAPVIPAATGYQDSTKTSWSPICCTLIQGPKSAVLVDTPTTVDLAEQLADWVKKTAPGGKAPVSLHNSCAWGPFFRQPRPLKALSRSYMCGDVFRRRGNQAALVKQAGYVAN